MAWVAKVAVTVVVRPVCGRWLGFTMTAGAGAIQSAKLNAS